MTTNFIRQLATTSTLALAAACLMGGCGSAIDKEAQQQFFENLGNSTITVFPTYVRLGDGHYNTESARQIAAVFQNNRFATTQIAATEIPVGGEWGMNQSKMFRDSAASVGQYVRHNPIDTDYALLAEYLMGRPDAVGGVHGYLVDKEGKLAWGFGVNSHHEVFNRFSPDSEEDCTAIACAIINERLSEEMPQKPEP